MTDLNSEEVPDNASSSPSIRKYVVEALLGILVGAALLVALVASTGEIPFVYQGY